MFKLLCSLAIFLQSVASAMPKCVQVSTGARLHFGLLTHAQQAQRQFGGVGLMLDEPGFELSAKPFTSTAQGDEFHVPDHYLSRVQDVIGRCRELAPGAPGCHWTLSKTIRPHVGLGSGTQLALAVAAAYTALRGEIDCPATELARRAGRGLRSALGIHGFQQGGFLVEVGKRASDQISPAASRIEWPAEWRIVLVRPQQVTGLSGTAEVDAFSKLPPMSKALSARLCQITLLELLPAILERDFLNASESLFEFGRLVGEYFSPAQGGTYAAPETRSLIRHLRAQGIRGVGQTSWGPTTFIMCPTADAAAQLVVDLQTTEWSASDILLTTGRNRGASIEVTDS